MSAAHARRSWRAPSINSLIDMFIVVRATLATETSTTPLFFIAAAPEPTLKPMNAMICEERVSVKQKPHNVGTVFTSASFRKSNCSRLFGPHVSFTSKYSPEHDVSRCAQPSAPARARTHDITLVLRRELDAPIMLLRNYREWKVFIVVRTLRLSDPLI